MNAPAAWARRLVVGLEGPWPSPREWSWLQRWQPAGIILFSRNIQSYNQLQDLCRVLKGLRRDLLICADHEGGPVSQLAGAVGRPPAAWGLGRLDDPDLSFRVHRETGRRLQSAGVDMVLGPCADIMTEKRNPVIGARAFGAEEKLVARHVVAAVRGLRESGLRACLKHWPGHGGAAVDSHQETPSVEVTAGQQAVFRAGLAAGAEGLMLGHLRCGDPERKPATLDAAGLEALREEMGREHCWLAVADDVSMGGLREPMQQLGITVPGDEGVGMLPVEHLPGAWFAALDQGGCDLWLLRGIPEAAFPVQEVGPAPRRGNRENAEPVFDEAPYQEARERLVVGAPAWSGQNLAVLDLAGQDRWQVAIGTGEREHRRLREALPKQWPCCHWSEAVGAAVPGEGPLDALLVASHRPLPDGWRQGAWFASLRPRLGAEGVCRVLGHPSLAQDMEAALPAGWIVTDCYDVTLADLNPS